MQKKYLVFMDIDGTLIDEQQTVSNKTIDTIKSLQKKDVQFYISTGRMFLSASVIRNDIDRSLGIIASNGCIYSLDKKTYLTYLSKEAVKDIISISNQFNLSAFFFDDHHVFYTKDLPHYFKNSDQNRIASPNPNDYIRITDATNKKFLNGIIIFDTPNSHLKQITAKLSRIKNLDISSSNTNNIELIPKNINKSTAIKSIQQKFNIPSSRTISFGDGLNDIEMFQQSGISVAMGNSPETVKKYANHVTDSNLEDGIANFLIQYFHI
ncbi:HAD family hydrolase [Pediococcus pentosaceus]